MARVRLTLWCDGQREVFTGEAETVAREIRGLAAQRYQLDCDTTLLDEPDVRALIHVAQELSSSQ